MNHEDFVNRLKRIAEGEQRRDIPKFQVPKFHVSATPRHFTEYRVWLYRVGLFLPERFFGTPISLRAEKLNVRDQFDYDLKYSSAIDVVVNLCNKWKLAKPGLDENHYDFGTPWNGWRVVYGLEELLSNRDQVRCIKKRFVLSVTLRDQDWFRVWEVVLNRVVHVRATDCARNKISETTA